MDKISFKAGYINSATIKEDGGNSGLIDKKVAVHKLNRTNNADLETLVELNRVWCGLYEDSLTTQIHYDFISKDSKAKAHEFFVISTQDGKSYKLDPKKILGIIEYTHDKSKKYDYIDFIQVNPEYMNDNKIRLLKGIGTALLDFIKSLTGFQNIYLNAVNESMNFYKKNEFEVIEKNIKDPLMLFKRKMITHLH